MTDAINPRAPRFLRFATSAPISVRAENDRTIDHIFSDKSVARDGDTISTAGWQLANFLKNPVYLWAHDSLSPPIGRVTSITPDNGLLRATVQYADADTYPFADTIFRLTKSGYINASSVSWLPIKWRYAADKGRAPGAIDFLEQELLEASAVPLPALASALVSARSAGIDTGPVFDWATRALDVGGFAVLPRHDLEILRKESRMATATRAEKSADWKVGAARDLPVSDKASWDGPAAAKRMLDAASKDNSIGADAKRGFLIYDAANADLRGSYKEPFADLVDGKLTAIAGGIRAAASRLPDVGGASDEVKAEARKVLDGYEAKMKSSKDDRAASFDKLRMRAANTRALGKDLRQRGLYELAGLCSLLSQAEWLYQNVCYEADAEGDGSPIPDRLAAWLDEGNLIIAAMADEETQENLKGAAADEIERAVSRALAGAGFTRSGKVLSKENARCLRSAHDHIETARCLVRSVIDKNGEEPDDENPEESDTDGDTDDARALRVRKAHALKRRAL